MKCTKSVPRRSPIIGGTPETRQHVNKHVQDYSVHVHVHVLNILYKQAVDIIYMYMHDCISLYAHAQVHVLTTISPPVAMVISVAYKECTAQSSNNKDNKIEYCDMYMSDYMYVHVVQESDI